MIKNCGVFGCLILLSVVLAGCQDDARQQVYHEVVIPVSKHPPLPSPPHEGGGNRPVSPVTDETPSLLWTTPQGWHVEKGSGMRLASLYPEGSDHGTECSIVVLGANSGTVVSNVIRWLGQLGIPSPDASAVNDFIAAQKEFETKEGAKGLLLDFSQFPTQGPQGKTMLASIISFPHQTVFIKLTTSDDKKARFDQPFLELSQSVKQK